MHKITIINDIHVFGPLQMMTLRELTEIVIDSDNPVIFLGDNIDVKNAERSRVKEALLAVEFFRKLSNVTYVGGNHEMDCTNLQQSHIIGTTYFNHSDMISNPERYGKFRKGTPGASWFKRNFITPLIDKGRHFIEVRPNDRMIAFMKQLKKDKPEITRALLAHAHPEKQIDFNVDGVKCSILPRGVTVVEV
jgi:predicted MPP superfamily phosphohydrolase